MMNDSGFFEIEMTSDKGLKAGVDGVKQILSTGDKKVELVHFADKTLAYVKSNMGYPAYYPLLPVNRKKPVKAVLKDLMDDPFKLIVYCLAFSRGNYLGVTLESKLAIGVAQIQVVVSVEKTHLIANVLRSKEFGVTIIPAKGMEVPVNVLMIYVKRKNVSAAIDIINEFSPQAVITINDVRHLHNAYIAK